MIAQNASSVLYVLMEMGAQHFGFTFARSLELLREALLRSLCFSTPDLLLR